MLDNEKTYATPYYLVYVSVYQMAQLFSYYIAIVFFIFK